MLMVDRYCQRYGVEPADFLLSDDHIKAALNLIVFRIGDAADAEQERADFDFEMMKLKAITRTR